MEHSPTRRRWLVGEKGPSNIKNSSQAYTEASNGQRTKFNCYMVRNFAPYRLLLRLVGCLFIENLTERSFRVAKTTWKKPYALYSFALVLSTVYFEGTLAVYYIIASAMTREFTTSLIAVLHVTGLANVLVNFCCMILGSNKLLKFFRKCAQYESHSTFQPPSSQKVRRRTYHITLLRVMIFTAGVTTYGFAVYFGVLLNPQTPWQISQVFAALVCKVCYFFNGSLMYLVVRSASEVILWYVSAQKQAFEDCIRIISGENLTPTAPSCAELRVCERIESIRLNILNVKDLVASINDIWSPAITMSSVCLLWVNCTALHGVAIRGAKEPDVCMVLICAAYLSLCFFELALISHSLRDETQSLKESAQAATTFRATDSYYRQVKFLHESIHPKEMCLCGGGFFRLDKSLIVSMTGALITYTVILVQTSPTLTQRPDLHATFNSS